MHTLRKQGQEVEGLDLLPSPTTTLVGSLTDRNLARQAMQKTEAVLHAATLHKPHVATHTRQQFVDTNVTGTLTLLEEAAAAGVKSFVFTSTTSAFGKALTPPEGEPAAWVTEEVVPVPRNIYGVTKTAAEDICLLVHRDTGMPCVVLRTSRFFPEEDDRPEIASAYADGNLKAMEFLYRRVEIEDAVAAHLLAIEHAPRLGFGKYIISATTPFTQADLRQIRTDAPAVMKRLYPEYEAEFARRGWRMFPGLERVYVNAKARRDLGWQPRWDFAHVLSLLSQDHEPRSEMALQVGSKGYHRQIS